MYCFRRVYHEGLFRLMGTVGGEGVEGFAVQDSEIEGFGVLGLGLTD